MQKQIIFTLLCASLFIGCASIKPVNHSFEDATLVAEQRAEIERLKRDIADMGAAQQEVSDGIDRFTGRVEAITDRLTSSIARCDSIEAVFTEIDSFVRELITENSELRKLQSADRGADAGQR